MAWDRVAVRPALQQRAQSALLIQPLMISSILHPERRHFLEIQKVRESIRGSWLRACSCELEWGSACPVLNTHKIQCVFI